MANFWYGLGIQHLANGDVDYLTATIKIALVSAAYTPAQNTDEFFSVAVASGNIVAVGIALTSKTNVLGLLSAASPVTWPTVTGAQVTQAVGYVDGTPGSGDFILFNQNVGTNLPVTPNGNKITQTIDPVNGIGTI